MKDMGTKIMRVFYMGDQDLGAAALTMSSLLRVWERSGTSIGLGMQREPIFHIMTQPLTAG